MAPRRRTVLATLAAGTVPLVAGCVDEGDLVYWRDFVLSGAGDVECDGSSTGPADSPSVDVGTGRWPMPGYDQQNTNAAPPGAAPEDCPRVQWHLDPRDPLDSMGSINRAVVADGRLVHSYQSQILGIDLERGTIDWEYDQDGAVGSLAVHRDTLYSFRNRMIPIDPETGEDGPYHPFGVTAQRSVDPVPIVDGVAYVPFDGFSLSAVTLEGEPIWSGTVAGAGDADRHALGNVRRPAIAEGIVYAGSGDAGLSAFDAATGDEHWADPEASVGYQPVVGEEYVYVQGRPGLRAYDRHTGEVAWTALEEENLRYTPALGDDRLFTQAGSTGDMAVIAVDATTGERRWTREITRARDQPTVAGDVVLVTDDGSLWAYDVADGSVRWQLSTATHAMRAPAVVDGTVILQTRQRIYALA